MTLWFRREIGDEISPRVGGCSKAMDQEQGIALTALFDPQAQWSFAGADIHMIASGLVFFSEGEREARKDLR